MSTRDSTPQRPRPPTGILLSELRHVVASLQPLLGQYLRDVWVPTHDAVVLRIGKTMLLMERYPLPRIHPITKRQPNPKTPFSFQGLLRARLSGRLDAIEVANDRVVDLVFGGHRLHVRLFGRGGGIWLLEGQQVLGAVDGPALAELPELPHSVPRADPPRFQPAQGGDWAEAARTWFEPQAVLAQRHIWLSHVRSGLRRATKQQKRLVANLGGDLDRAERSDQLRHQADCLAARLHQVKRGTSELEVPDIMEPSKTVRVSLDPSRPPSATLQKLYKKASRLERATEHILERLLAAETRAAELKAATASLDESDLGGLRRLAKTWRLGVPSTKPRQREGNKAGWSRWVGPGGEEILVGKTASGNRALTFRHARGRDWWFHLRDRPGAHVLLRRNSKTAPPLELILAAAQLILLYARTPPGSSDDVQYARVSNLRSLPDAGIAGVAITREKVIHVQRDDEELVGWRREDLS